MKNSPINYLLDEKLRIELSNKLNQEILIKFKKEKFSNLELLLLQNQNCQNNLIENNIPLPKYLKKKFF
jgi:hypothetical protein